MNRNWYIQPKTTIEELLLLKQVGSPSWFQNGLCRRLVDLGLFWLFVWKNRSNLNESVVAP